MAAIPLFFACLLLMIGWKVGPQRLIDAARLRKLTASANARVVESWLALDWDPAEMGSHHYWRNLANVSPCAVVEYDVGWQSGIRKAFCGPSFPFSENPLSGMTLMSAQVPFAWSRDVNGFAVPEIRMSAATRRWLATHPEPDSLPNDPPLKTALESLTFDNDRPIDLAAAGWMRPARTLPLAFDPHDPKGALPAGFLTQAFDMPPAWFLLAFFAFFFAAGAVVWVIAVTFLLGASRGPIFWILVVVPLLALPWWGGPMPRLLGRLSPKLGEVLTLFLKDVDRSAFMGSGSPDEALLAHGERIVWRFDRSRYAPTLGQFHFAPPRSMPRSEKEAYGAMSDEVTPQVLALDPSAQTKLFADLLREKEARMDGAGPVFIDAASRITADKEANPEARHAADRFLQAWGHFFNIPEAAR